jgi:hypothetical protein
MQGDCACQCEVEVCGGEDGNGGGGEEIIYVSSVRAGLR